MQRTFIGREKQSLLAKTKKSRMTRRHAGLSQQSSAVTSNETAHRKQSCVCGKALIKREGKIRELATSVNSRPAFLGGEHVRLVTIRVLEWRQISGRARRSVMCIFFLQQMFEPGGWVFWDQAPQRGFQLLIQPFCLAIGLGVEAPSWEQNSVQNAETNWGLRSETRSTWIPWRRKTFCSMSCAVSLPNGSLSEAPNPEVCGSDAPLRG